MRSGLPHGFFSRIRIPNAQDAVLFFGAFALFSFLVSFFGSAFSPPGRTSFDSSSIDNREFVYFS